MARQIAPEPLSRGNVSEYHLYTGGCKGDDLYPTDTGPGAITRGEMLSIVARSRMQRELREVRARWA